MQLAFMSNAKLIEEVSALRKDREENKAELAALRLEVQALELPPKQRKTRVA